VWQVVGCKLWVVSCLLEKETWFLIKLELTKYCQEPWVSVFGFQILPIRLADPSPAENLTPETNFQRS
jgi:hypothetical protein